MSLLFRHQASQVLPVHRSSDNDSKQTSPPPESLRDNTLGDAHQPSAGFSVVVVGVVVVVVVVVVVIFCVLRFLPPGPPLGKEKMSLTSSW